MEKQNENLRERLLARMPQPENLETYRKEVEASLQKNQRAFRREKWGVGALWLYVIAFFLVLTLYRGGNWISTPHGHLAEMTWLSARRSQVSDSTSGESPSSRSQA